MATILEDEKLQMSRPALQRTLRVAYCIDSMAVSGGTELNSYRVAASIPRDCVEPLIITLNEDGGMRQRYEAAGVPVYAFPVPSLVGVRALQQARDIARLFTREEIDVVHTHDCYTNFLGVIAARIAGIPVVASKRWMVTVFPQHRWTNRIAYRLADRVVANCTVVAESLTKQDLVRRDRVSLIPNFVDDLAFDVPSGAREQRRSELGLSANTCVFIIVAQLRPEKAHSFLLDAFALVANTFPDCHLVIVGDGPERPAIESKIAKLHLLSRVSMMGHQANPKEWLVASDVGLLVSDHEGFPNALLEAMAAGLPVIATDVGGVRDAISDETVGILVPPRNVMALSDAMVELAANGRRRLEMGWHASNKVRQNFHRGAVLEMLVSLYQQLAGDK